MEITRLAFRHDQTDHQRFPKLPLAKQKQRSITSLCSCSANLLVSLLTTIITLLILFQIQSINLPSSTSPSWLTFRKPAASSSDHLCGNGGNCCSELENARSRLRQTSVFRPTKDRSLERKPFDNNTFFLSTIDYTHVDEGIKYVHLPSEPGGSENRLLCVTGDNQYTLAWPDALPRNATLLRGLTFIADTYYQYVNLWHALCAFTPFASWTLRNCGASPERWLLFYHGELTRDVGHWAKKLMAAATGREVVLMEDFAGGPKCFERALVFKNNEGKMNKTVRGSGIDLLRCKARKYCGVTPKEVAGADPTAIRLTLLLRVKNRRFKDENAVINIFETECGKVKGCSFTVRWGDNMTFCEQVKVLSKTDIMASPHGAQMTNFIFMEKNSSIMEFFPKGWKEHGGSGQALFHWLADYAGMRHRGEWRDTEGPPCPYNDRMQCFFFYKNGNIGHDVAAIANFTSRVLNEVKAYKISEAARGNNKFQASCSCS